MEGRLRRMTGSARIAWIARALLIACVLLPAAANAQEAGIANADPQPATSPAAASPVAATGTAAPGTRSGLEIYARFREGLADPDCPVDSSSERWRRHFEKAPQRLGESD